MARNGRFGRLAKSAGFRRNPQQHAGTGAIRQEKTPTENGWGFGYWWRWRELNPRPKALDARYYMLSSVLGLVHRQHTAPSAPINQPA